MRTEEVLFESCLVQDAIVRHLVDVREENMMEAGVRAGFVAQHVGAWHLRAMGDEALGDRLISASGCSSGFF